MGDFYELFFEDAVKAAKALDIALTKRGQHGGQDIPMCGVPAHAMDGYLAKLIRSGFKVAVCEQMEDPAEAKKRGAKAVVRREVIRVVTPGTITEDALLDARRHNYLAALGGCGRRDRTGLARHVDRRFSYPADFGGGAGRGAGAARSRRDPAGRPAAARSPAVRAVQRLEDRPSRRCPTRASTATTAGAAWRSSMACRRWRASAASPGRNSRRPVLWWTMWRRPSRASCRACRRRSAWPGAPCWRSMPPPGAISS